MSILKVKPGRLVSEVSVPSSKSYANRALILGALSSEPVTIAQLPHSTDVTILVECLKEVGLEFRHDDQTLKILNSFPACAKAVKPLSVGEGGTTARFLAALLLRSNLSYELVLGERLKERPWEGFLKVAKDLGAEAELRGNRLRLKGPLKAVSRVEVDCSKTTQFASAFQLGLAGTPTEVIPLHLSASKSYWAMTEEIKALMSVSSSYTVPLDWSSASYPLAFGALNQEIRFPGLIYDPYQADAKFLLILKELGSVTEGPVLSVGPCTQMKAMDLDVSDALDLVPTLGFFLSHIMGTHALRGIGNLVYKESDRLAELMKLLSLFGKRSWTEGDVLHIQGSPDRVQHPVDLTLPEDHRMVMVGTLFLLHHGGGSVGPVEAVNKSYPEFFNLISQKG